MPAISESVISSWCICVSLGNFTCLFLMIIKSKGMFSIVSTSPPKWLNINLDINGILCHCIKKAETNKMSFVNDVRDAIHSSTVPTIVGSKAVFTPPGLLEFFTAISKFVARVFIWRSMVCHPLLKSLDKTVAERLKPLGGSTSKSLVD
jgi:hypothetical protein